MRIFKILLLSCFALSTIVACKSEPKTVKQAKVTFSKEGELTLYKSDSDTIIAKLDIEIAKTDFEIQTGLMYRDSMKENQGMLFVFNEIRERNFYMKNTRFPLDLIFLDHNKKVVSFQENAQPLDERSLPSNALAQFVLEVNAGLCEKWFLEVGDTMDYFEYKLVR
ncbi:DUF192 domain-containing protein [Lacinutrix sp. MedPE-SW]|uniref:DUF192 domain-containing protein n=1 Tax=Lacinutrix sp. MedPE-SW TaxID=1860087 RepID=UPI00091E9CD5|nr:DUF192 domain-containing protein [Lacinutrix sp. MedPE-SW]OIQ21629.1 MAG: hypothetical protein BM549_09310 [Lacinutrix sp. MedPE-SW]